MYRKFVLRLLTLICLTAAAFAQQSAAPTPAAGPGAATAPAFPPLDPKNFTADLPKPATVDAFLKAQIGFDSERVWQVASVRKTIAPGYSEVQVLVAQKGSPEQPRVFRMLVTPDQKFAIQDSTVVPFGADPFATARAILAKRAEGPWRGAAGKELEIVEFSDFECPHCKAAQPIMENLLRDFPNAHFVAQQFPLVRIHPWAHKAAAYGVCVAEQGRDAYFKFADAVFDSQEKITESNADDMLKAAATKAGADANQAGTCAVSSAALAKVDASSALAEELGVDSTPTIYVNGREIAMSPNLTYELLQKIVRYQAEIDGVKLPPEMGTLPK